MRLLDRSGVLTLRRDSTCKIRRYAIEAGMVTLRMDGWRKAREGVTTVDEVLKGTQDDA